MAHQRREESDLLAEYGFEPLTRHVNNTKDLTLIRMGIVRDMGRARRTFERLFTNCPPAESRYS